MDSWKRVPTLNQRPTQAPLNRDEQKSAFELLKQQYSQESAPQPVAQFGGLKEYKLSEEEALRAMQSQLQERNIQPQVQQQLEAKLEEKQQTAVVKQFYCTHVFTSVRASFMGLPIRYKMCNKCQLVK